MIDRVTQCVQAVRSKLGNNLEIHLPRKQDTEKIVCFRLDQHAIVDVFIKDDTFSVYVTAFYQQSASEEVASAENIPGAIQRLYRILLGPSGEGPSAESGDGDLMTDLKELMRRMKEDRSRNQRDNG